MRKAENTKRKNEAKAARAADKLYKGAHQRETKTNHRTGYHKPIKNPTHNYPPDEHKAFCSRCMGYNLGCPENGYRPTKSKECSV